VPVAPQLGIVLQSYSVLSADNINAALEAAEQADAQALFVMEDPMIQSNRTRIAEFALRKHWPAIGEFRPLVDAGGLMSYTNGRGFRLILGFPNQGNSDSMLALERGAGSMGGAVRITRRDLTAKDLRAAAGREKDGSAARRMLALAMVLDGVDRKSAAESCGMDRQTLRDWVHRYNAEGLGGLHDLKTPGPTPKLTAEQQAELARLVEAGPDPAHHGVVRWRRVDLRDELERRFGVALHERSVGKVLAKLGYRRLSVRPRHPQADEEAQEAFKKTSPRRSRHSFPTTPRTSRSKSGSRTRLASVSKGR